MLNDIIWLANTLGVQTWQVIAIIGSLGILGGYSIAHNDKAYTKEPTKNVEVNINPIDLWELKKLGR